MSKRTNQKQAARVVREQLARERRRQRTVWTAVIAATVLVVAGMVGWAVYSTQDTDDYTAPPGVAAGDDSGIAVGDGPVTVDVYADFLCPACQQYEQLVETTMDELLEQDRITMVFHPMAILNNQSTTQYSTRAGSAAACASQFGEFREYAAALFANQPTEGGAGLSDDELIRIGGEAGIVDPDFAECVRGRTYHNWVDHVTEVASERGITSTPTVLVNGREIERSAEALRQAVEGAAP